MKKVYMPTDDMLIEMQSMGANVDQYVTIKMAESIMVDGKNYPAKGMLKGCYKYLKDNSSVVHAVCLLYPDEIKHSELASYDTKLLEQLINKNNNKSIYNLDYLCRFVLSSQYSVTTTYEVVNKLASELPNNPEYRFEYAENRLLDDLFNGELIIAYPTLDFFKQLVTIEPAYALLFKNKIIKEYGTLDMETISELLKTGLMNYVQRYGLEYQPNYYNFGIDIEKRDTKKLIKAIRRNKNNLY